METLEHSRAIKQTNFRTVAGVILIAAGGVLFLDRYLKTGWLSLLILPAIGLFLYLWGVRARSMGLILAGGLLCGAGAGGIAAWGPSVQLAEAGKVGFSIPSRPLFEQVGLLALYLGIGWVVSIISITMLTTTRVWWALVPMSVFILTGTVLLYSPLRWVDFVLYLAVGIGLPLLVWGVITRRIGLLIPGCLLLGIGPGIYFGWRTPDIGNGLVQTGIMLIGFAFGWILITAAARWINRAYVWWPLIPGGILAMVGMGLYIGGDPKHALGFISNTGSIALMIFGLYLLLMRKGIHH